MLITTIYLKTIQKYFYSSKLKKYTNKLVFQVKQYYGRYKTVNCGKILKSDNPVISCQIIRIKNK